MSIDDSSSPNASSPYRVLQDKPVSDDNVGYYMPGIARIRVDRPDTICQV